VDNHVHVVEAKLVIPGVLVLFVNLNKNYRNEKQNKYFRINIFYSIIH
jgi:hypothetical protein